MVNKVQMSDGMIEQPESQDDWLIPWFLKGFIFSFGKGIVLTHVRIIEKYFKAFNINGRNLFLAQKATLNVTITLIG